VITNADVHPAAVIAWYGDAGQAPADTRTPEHPSRTRQWAQAWQHITTEQVLAYRHAVVDDGTVRETVPFQLTSADGSPCWSMLETGAGTGPIWTGRVLYAGSPYAQYGGAGTAAPALAASTARAGLDLGAELDATAIVYPGLTPLQAERLRDAATRTARGQVLDLAITLTHTRRLAETPDAWWRGIPQRYRNDARRHWRRGTEAGLTLTAHHDTDLPLHAAAFADLANATAAKHTGGSQLYGTDMFRHLATVPGAVLLAARDQTGRLAGGFYGWLHRRRLYLWAAGIDPDHPAARHTYKWLIAEAAQWAIDHGATHLDLGRGNHHAKAKLGCQPQILRTVVHLPHPQPATTRSLARMSARLGQQAAPYLPVGATW
jgi:CelD/BcsL family acetyltransferase involved in cellulose biosynthesis